MIARLLRCLLTENKRAIHTALFLIYFTLFYNSYMWFYFFFLAELAEKFYSISMILKRHTVKIETFFFLLCEFCYCYVIILFIHVNIYVYTYCIYVSVWLSFINCLYILNCINILQQLTSEIYISYYIYLLNLFNAKLWFL